MKYVLTASLAALVLLAPAFGQYPGQQGPPIGQYPPGQAPPDPSDPNAQPGQYPGRGGLSIPRKNKKKGAEPDPTLMNTISADGFVVSNKDKEFVIFTEDQRRITMSVNTKTAFLKGEAPLPASKFEEGATVHIEAAEDEEAFLTAVKIVYLKDAPPHPAEGAAPNPETLKQVDPKTAAELAKPAATDAPDRPILRRGRPAGANEYPENETPPTPPPAAAKKTTASSAKNEKKDSGDFTITSDDVQHMKVAGDDDQIARSREWADTFTEGLPNYVCDQITTRYQEQSRSSGWTALDIVTAKIVVENGHEQYKDITVGGKRVNKGMLEIGGSTSTGEFSGYLQALLLTHAAKFKFSESTTVTSTPAAIYNFTVPLKANRGLWSIKVGGQELFPQYSGAVWLEKSSGAVRRIEFQADKIPKDFPDDSLEIAVDYDMVHLGTNTYLLPVHAANIACHRGTSVCTKNEIDFRDYHKYAGESTIVYK